MNPSALLHRTNRRFCAVHVKNAPQAKALIEGLPADIVMADAAYDSDALRRAVAEMGAKVVIPKRENSPSIERYTASAT